MNLIWFILSLFIYSGLPSSFSKNVSSRPAIVNIGALFTFNSTIGRVAKIAIEEAVKDVNSNSSILHGTKLVVTMHDSNCSGFLGMVEGTLSYLVSCFIFFYFYYMHVFNSENNLIILIRCPDYYV